MAKNNGVRDWIRQNAPKVKDWEKFIVQTQKKFGMERKRVRDAIVKLRSLGELPTTVLMPTRSLIRPQIKLAVKPSKPFRTSVDLSEVAGEYDEEAKIKAGLEALGTRLIRDNDFRVELGIPLDRWKVVSNMKQFEVNKRELKGKRFRGIYWGRAAVIKELSRKIDILP